jgi:hypothetical protein
MAAIRRPQRCIFANSFNSTLRWRLSSFCWRARMACWACCSASRVFTAGLRCNHADLPLWLDSLSVPTSPYLRRKDSLVHTPRTSRPRPASARIAARDLRLFVLIASFLDEALLFHNGQIIVQLSYRNHISFRTLCASPRSAYSFEQCACSYFSWLLSACPTWLALSRHIPNIRLLSTQRVTTKGNLLLHSSSHLLNVSSERWFGAVQGKARISRATIQWRNGAAVQTVSRTPSLTPSLGPYTTKACQTQMRVIPAASGISGTATCSWLSRVLRQSQRVNRAYTSGEVHDSSPYDR